VQKLVQSSGNSLFPRLLTRVEHADRDEIKRNVR